MRGIIKIGTKLFLLIIPFFAITPIAMVQFPMRFFDGEYSWYQENKEYSKGHDEYSRVLIMGDSTAKAGYLPCELSEDTYNFALGGASPIEEFYYLKEYLQNNRKPEYIVYTQTARYFLVADCFWSRSVYFHRISKEDLLSLKSDLVKYGDTSIFGKRNFSEQIFLYKTYSPIKYGTAFAKALLKPERYGQNKDRYTSVIENNGQNWFGMNSHCDEISMYGTYDSFEENKIIDSYFRKIIELCEENDIQFIFQNPPLNRSTYEVLNQQFVDDYTQYLARLQSDYPDARIDTELFCYENDYFGDAAHLNERGTIKFSREMRSKYDFVFEQG